MAGWGEDGALEAHAVRRDIDAIARRIEHDLSVSSSAEGNAAGRVAAGATPVAPIAHEAAPKDGLVQLTGLGPSRLFLASPGARWLAS